MVRALYNLRIRVEEWDEESSRIFPNITRKLRGLQDKYKGFFRVLETGELLRGRQEGLPTHEAEMQRTHTVYVGCMQLYLVEQGNRSFLNTVPHIVSI